MRRANGTGTVIKMKGNRRKKYRVRVTKGWTIDEKTGKAKQIIKDLGCYMTQKEANDALQDYLGCPYDLTASRMTMKELYDVWFEEYSADLKGDSSRRTITNAFEYCTSLYNMNIRDIRSYHLKECIRTAERVSTRGSNKGEVVKASACTQARIKSIFNLMFDWAYERELIDRNYARAFELDKNIKEKKKRDKRVNRIFDKDEIQKLWDNIDKVKFADMTLVGIYSGWRPQELAILRIKDIDLEDNTFRGGIKTTAGINRIVPIHPDIKPLVVKRYNEAVEMGSDFLFNDPDGQRGTVLTYDKWRKRFDKVMKALSLYPHHPHETRHTFYTQANRSGIDPTLRDRIMGHATDGTLAGTYDHRDIEDMKKAVNNIKFL